METSQRVRLQNNKSKDHIPGERKVDLSCIPACEPFYLFLLFHNLLWVMGHPFILKRVVPCLYQVAVVSMEIFL